MMGKELAGYYIGDNIHFELARKKLIKLDGNGRPVHSFTFRDTMLRLFLYLLEHADGDIVTNEQILFEVWDAYGLKSSSQRLWQVMQSLKFRLVMLGGPHDLIMRIETFDSKGYTLKKGIVRPFYFIGN
jgi:DNA-binding winged helix-turn-helix (wHTH) protein